MRSSCQAVSETGANSAHRHVYPENAATQNSEVTIS